MNGSATLVALLFGVIAGLRTFTAPAAVTWAVHFGRLDVSGTWLGFLGSSSVRWILTGLALFEMFFDQMPTTARRTVPWQFSGRLIAGALSGAAVGASGGHGPAGAVAGIAGAALGTLAGVRARAWLAD